MSRIELKCRCGSSAVFEGEDVPGLLLGYRAEEWLRHHDACPHQPAVAPRFPGGIWDPLPCVHDCAHDFEQTTAGHRCRKCGFSTVGSSSWGAP